MGNLRISWRYRDRLPSGATLTKAAAMIGPSRTELMDDTPIYGGAQDQVAARNKLGARKPITSQRSLPMGKRSLHRLDPHARGPGYSHTGLRWSCQEWPVAESI